MQTTQRNIFSRFLLAVVNIWESPWGSAIFAGLIFFIIAAFKNVLFTHSKTPYFNYLADAFLHGQFSLRSIPPTTHDLVLYTGKYFLYWAPFPAIVLMPFVALFGVGLNDVVYTIIIAMANVGLIALLLRAAGNRGILHFSKAQQSILVAFFALGTVHFILAPYGRVWATSQLIGFTCTILAYLAAFSFSGRKAWFFTGLALTGAMLTRNNLVFTGIFPAVFLLVQDKPWIWRKAIRNLLTAAIPLSIGLTLYLFYNYSRFGSPFNVGIPYHLMADFFKADYLKYGYFNLHYVPINIYYQYVFYPFPLREESLMGGSLFLLSPLFVGAIFAFFKPRAKWIVWMLFASIFFTNIPILLCMGTGYMQFGPRYTLDFYVPLLLLTGIGIEKWKNGVSFSLALAAIVQFIIGVSVWS